MPLVAFTRNLRRHVDCPTAEVAGTTVAECLAAYFARYPAVRSYVLDEQGAVRRHVAVFVGNGQLVDPARCKEPPGRVFHDLGESPDCGGDDREAGGHGLQRGDGQILGV